METLGVVEEIHRYPVKSMLGESVRAAEFTGAGIAGDRVWAVRDEARGDFMTGKRVAALMGCTGRPAAEAGGVPEIELPTGDVFAADDPLASRRLSAFLGREVTLWPCDGAPAPSPPRGTREEANAEVAAIFARAAGEVTPDLSKIPPEFFEFIARPDSPFVDLAPLLLVTVQSIATIARAAPDSTIDPRRFRPSVSIRAQEHSPFPEQGWIGRRLRAGEAEWRVRMACPRCVMTTHGFADVPKDPTVMRRLVSEAGGDLGVYASVERGGRVGVGDIVAAVD